MTFLRIAAAAALVLVLAPGARADGQKPPTTTKLNPQEKSTGPTTRPAPIAVPPSTTLSAADEAAVVQFMNKLIDTVVADENDCAKMAADVNALVAANQPLLATAQASSGKQLSQAAKGKLQKRVQQEELPALQKKCMSDKGVQAAMEKIAAPK